MPVSMSTHPVSTIGNPPGPESPAHVRTQEDNRCHDLTRFAWPADRLSCPTQVNLQPGTSRRLGRCPTSPIVPALASQEPGPAQPPNRSLPSRPPGDDDSTNLLARTTTEQRRPEGPNPQQASQEDGSVAPTEGDPRLASDSNLNPGEIPCHCACRSLHFHLI